MATANFTIYRLNFQDFEFEDYCDSIISKYNGEINDSKKYLLKTNSKQVKLRNIKDYKLYIREGQTKPDWQYVLKGLVSDLDQMENINHSFVLFLKVGNEVFCITGGTGYLVIGGVKDHYFGLNLLSRIIDPNEDIIKETRDRYFAGNRISGQNQFSRFVNINSERGISNYFKELNVFLPKGKIQKAFGLEIDGEKKDYKFLAKDSIKLGKSLEITELDILLKKTTDLLDAEPLFIINRFYEINNQDSILKRLDSSLEADFKRLIDGSKRDTEIEIVLPLVSCDSIKLEKKGTIQELNYTDNMTDIANFFKLHYDKKILTEGDGAFIAGFLKKTIFVGKIDNQEVLRSSLYNAIDYHVRLDENNYWLMDGKWHSLESEFMSEIDTQFTNKVASKLTEPSNFQGLLDWKTGSEGEYNFLHDSIENVYVLDKILIDNIELCDLLVVDHNKIFFVHVKNGLDGEARVLSAQIASAMNVLNNALFHDNTLFEKYYNSICRKIGNKSEEKDEETTMSLSARKFCKQFPTVDDFIDLMQNIEEISFVFAFRPNNQIPTNPETIRSTAAKLSMINIVDETRQYNFKLEFYEIKK